MEEESNRMKSRIVKRDRINLDRGEAKDEQAVPG